MAKYQVLKPIEYDGKLYLPPGNAHGIQAHAFRPGKNGGPPTVPSASNGQLIPVDSSGLIQMEPDEAEDALALGTLALIQSPAVASSPAKKAANPATEKGGSNGK